MSIAHRSLVHGAPVSVVGRPIILFNDKLFRKCCPSNPEQLRAVTSPAMSLGKAAIRAAVKVSGDNHIPRNASFATCDTRVFMVRKPAVLEVLLICVLALHISWIPEPAFSSTLLRNIFLLTCLPSTLTSSNKRDIFLLTCFTGMPFKPAVLEVLIGFNRLRCGVMGINARDNLRETFFALQSFCVGFHVLVHMAHMGSPGRPWAPMGSLGHF